MLEPQQLQFTAQHHFNATFSGCLRDDWLCTNASHWATGGGGMWGGSTTTGTGTRHTTEAAASPNDATVLTRGQPGRQINLYQSKCASLFPKRNMLPHEKKWLRPVIILLTYANRCLAISHKQELLRAFFHIRPKRRAAIADILWNFSLIDILFYFPINLKMDCFITHTMWG